MNVLTAALALGRGLFYVVVYTCWLKRRTPQNIVIGGAAGAVPPLVGWAAVTGEVGLPALFMFAIVFYWTPPHFWALAILAKDDYARGRRADAAGRARRPARRRGRSCSTRCCWSACRCCRSCRRRSALVYLVAAVALGGVVPAAGRAAAARHQSRANARALFLYSLAYLALMFAAIGIDRINF